MRLLPLFLVLAALIPVTYAPLSAADAAAAQLSAEQKAEKAQLRLAFEERLAGISTLKASGVVGETTDGQLAPTGEGSLDAASKTLVEAENRDRLRLYDLLAAETSAPVEQVAERAARRNYQMAAPGERLRKKDGTWAKK
jgi:uncharacterized protein YdbL (DUF1318 family)